MLVSSSRENKNKALCKMSNQYSKIIVSEFVDVEVKVLKDSVGTKFWFTEQWCLWKCRRKHEANFEGKHQKESLQQILLEMDEETYHQIDVCNPVGVLRALEIVPSNSVREILQNQTSEMVQRLLTTFQQFANACTAVPLFFNTTCQRFVDKCVWNKDFFLASCQQFVEKFKSRNNPRHLLFQKYGRHKNMQLFAKHSFCE